jgi:hypothetical protein
MVGALIRPRRVVDRSARPLTHGWSALVVVLATALRRDRLSAPRIA